MTVLAAKPPQLTITIGLKTEDQKLLFTAIQLFFLFMCTCNRLTMIEQSSVKEIFHLSQSGRK